MTIPDNATLAAALDKRLSFFRDKDAVIAAQIADLTAERQDLRSHISELEWMKEQLAPVEMKAAPTKVAKKSGTIAECLVAMRAKFILPLTPGVTDRMAQEQLAKLGYEFRLPTVRYALAQIGQESRAVTTQSSPAESPPVGADGGAGRTLPATEPSASGQAAQHRPGSQEAPGNSAGGAGDEDFPIMRRVPRPAPAAAE